MNITSSMAGIHRLPVYIAIDVSASMFGQAAEAFKQGVKYLVGALNAEDFASDIYVSLITFNNHATRDIPLMPLESFKFENLELGGASRLVPLLELLEICMEDDLRPSTDEGRGDYKALVFLFTDGRFNDRWERKKALLEKLKRRCARFVLIGCGSSADYEALHNVSPDVIRIDSYQPGVIDDYLELIWY